ncbi:MAG: hypothetical protein Q4D38_06315 [Planctomycetia bacterium]|nr:hypothetical protein [Planctomycetia bacterium]
MIKSDRVRFLIAVIFLLGSISYVPTGTVFCLAQGRPVSRESSEKVRDPRKAPPKSAEVSKSRSKSSPMKDEDASRAPGAKKSKSSQASRESKESKKTKEPKKSPPKKKGKKAKEPEDTRTFEEKERDRIAHFKETGIWLWPELSDEQFEKRTTEQKEYLEKVKAAFPQLPLAYYESKHFFYLTDAPPLIANQCLQYLEAMHEKLSQIFGFPKDHPVWYGKCIVVAFVHQQNFQLYEQTFFQNNSMFEGASGLAHTRSDGDVVISLFYGDVSRAEGRWRFFGVLVHETTHGFVHRYRARQEVPLWLNEGLAEFMACTIIPADRQVPLKQKKGLEMMRQTGSVGGLLDEEMRLDLWQYGVTSGLVMHIFKQNPKAFVEFFDSVKDGKEWRQALMDSYKCTPEEMLIHFGRANRIPQLRP